MFRIDSHRFNSVRMLFFPVLFSNKITKLSLPIFQSFESIFENEILKKRVVWQRTGPLGFKANFGENVTAELFHGLEDNNTTIKISDGTNSIYRELDEYWLENWKMEDS